MAKRRRNLRFALNFPWPIFFLMAICLFYLLKTILKKHAQIKKFKGTQDSGSLVPGKPSKQLFSRFLIIFVIALLSLIALQRPEIFVKRVPKNIEASKIVFILDVSKSMDAKDIAPSRFERAKFEIKSMSKMLRGNLLSLIVFSGQAFIQCPFTTDTSAFHSFVDAAQTNMLARGGTDFTALLQMMQQKIENDNETMTVLLFSDGEAHDEEWQESFKTVKERAVFYTVGLGGKIGEPIPLGEAGEGYQKNRKGKTIMSSQNEKTLKELASGTGGKYVNLQLNPAEITKIYATLRDLDKEKLDQKDLDIYESQGHWICLAVFFLFTLFLYRDKDFA